MARCIIFGAAEFDSLLLPIQQDDYVIAADGGVSHCARMGLTPDAVLGDFDSLGYVPKDAKVFPVEKDDTDVMLAIRHGLDAGCREFFIYGGMDGIRVDHTMANFQALAFLREENAHGFLIGRHQIAAAIANETLTFPKTAEGIISAFCLGEPATGISIRGLQYSLESGSLSASFPLGVSNHFVGEKAEISVENGCLLLIWDRKAGLPECIGKR